MKRTVFTESQIINFLKEVEAGTPLDDVCRQHAFSKSAFYRWKTQYGGLEVSALKRLKELEVENQRLKQMYADLSLEHKALKDIVQKKL